MILEKNEKKQVSLRARDKGKMWVCAKVAKVMQKRSLLNLLRGFL